MYPNKNLYCLLLFSVLLLSCSSMKDTSSPYKAERIYKENYDRLSQRVYSWFSEFGATPELTSGLDSNNKKYEIFTASYKKGIVKALMISSKKSRYEGSKKELICDATVKLVRLDDSTTSVTTNMSIENNPNYEIDISKYKRHDENCLLNFLCVNEGYLDKEMEQLEIFTFAGINLADSKWNMYFYWIDEFKGYKTQVHDFELIFNQDSSITLNFRNYNTSETKTYKGNYNLVNGILECFVVNSKYQFALRNGFLVGNMTSPSNDNGRCFGRRSVDIQSGLTGQNK